MTTKLIEQLKTLDNPPSDAAFRAALDDIDFAQLIERLEAAVIERARTIYRGENS